MMRCEWETQSDTLEPVLEAVAHSVERTAEGWHVVFGTPKTAAATNLRLENGSLWVDAPLPGAARGDAPVPEKLQNERLTNGKPKNRKLKPQNAQLQDWNILGWNGRLSGGVKIVRVGPGPDVRLRAELPVDTWPDLREPIRALSAGVLEANALARAGFDPSVAGWCRPDADLGKAPAWNVEALCAECGWTFSPREDAGGMIDLALEDDFRQARIVALDEGASALWVDLAEAAPGSELGARAQAAFLLRAGGWLRGARPTVSASLPDFQADSRDPKTDTAVGWENDGPARPFPRFEAPLSAWPAPAELHGALCALSVACELSAREIQLLGQDETLARVYLEQSQLQPDCTTTTTASTTTKSQPKQQNDPRKED